MTSDSGNQKLLQPIMTKPNTTKEKLISSSWCNIGTGWALDFSFPCPLSLFFLRLSLIHTARNSFRMHWRSAFHSNGGKWGLESGNERERACKLKRESENGSRKWTMTSRERQEWVYLLSFTFFDSISWFLTNDWQAIWRSTWRHCLLLTR